MDFSQFDFTKLAEMAQGMGQGQSGGRMGGKEKESLLQRGMQGATSGMDAASNLAKLPQGMPMGGKGMPSIASGIPIEDQRAIHESMMGMANSPMGQAAQQYIQSMIRQFGADGGVNPGMQNRPTAGMPGLPGPNELNDAQIRDFIQKGIMRSN